MRNKIRRKQQTAGKRRSRRQFATGKDGAGTASLKKTVLSFLGRQERPVAMTTITGDPALAIHDPEQVRDVLDQLADERLVVRKGRRFTLAPQPERLRATIDLTSKGFGFATILGEAKESRDVFIAAHQLHSASQGDTVMVEITGGSRGRREGRVVEVLTRATSKLCGIFTSRGGAGQVIPDDPRLPLTVTIRRGDDLGAENGMAVSVEITDHGDSGQGPAGRVVEILGDPGSATVQIRMAIAQFGLRTSFPPAVMEEAAALAAVTACDAGRLDLLHLAHVTIDGETARDFDDAIFAERTENGFRLYVSIADVSHYVAPGSAIDREAFRRGTSVYLPDRVLPMLPERLSNDLCSLVPDQDRPAFTAILSFDHQGVRTGARYGKSMIRSRHRFTYTLVHRLLFLDDQEARKAHAPLVAMLEEAWALASLLKAQRQQRGSLDFNIPEPYVRLAGDGVDSIAIAERNQAHMLIEECMLAANEAVAQSLAAAGRQVLYRIHEYPDTAKLDTFTEAAKVLGLRLPRTGIGPGWFAEIIAQARTTPTEYVVNNLLLRTMQQARYSPENTGHFGLAAAFYLHFTSPIRRYPDLVAHRALQAWLTAAPAQAVHLYADGDKTIAEAATHLSQCERKAVDIERDTHARLSALFLLDRAGEIFAAIISGVTGFGLFVELEEHFISGSIPVRTMADDYYLHDARRFRLIGERTNAIYQLGDRVTVRLDHVDLAAKRIFFSLDSASGVRRKGGDRSLPARPA